MEKILFLFWDKKADLAKSLTQLDIFCDLPNQCENQMIRRFGSCFCRIINSHRRRSLPINLINSAEKENYTFFNFNWTGLLIWEFLSWTSAPKTLIFILNSCFPYFSPILNKKFQNVFLSLTKLYFRWKKNIILLLRYISH